MARAEVELVFRAGLGQFLQVGRRYARTAKIMAGSKKSFFKFSKHKLITSL
nr:MAG TPA: hypothetical protein [Caudoviricetes sp.]